LKRSLPKPSRLTPSEYSSGSPELAWTKKSGKLIERYGLRAAQIDDFLQARTGGAFHQKNFIERPAGAQSFPNGMNS